MVNEYEYQKEKYIIIEAIKIWGIDFVISKNNNNEITYMKITQLTNKTVFTPLDNLIKVLDAYNNNKIFSIKKILDYFVNSLNKSIKKDRIKLYDLNEIIIHFSSYIKSAYPLINGNISKKELKKIDKFIGTYESKPVYLKLCNAYSLVLLISIIGIIIFGKNLIVWYGEGRNTKTISNNIIANTNNSEKAGLNKDEIMAILEDEDDVDKYSYNYWGYSNVTLLSIDFKELLEQNPDTVGWLYVNNTNINYPVVQSGDNSYYLDHSFEKEYSNAGWIFADYRSNLTNLEKNTVIYGHGRKDNTMFGTLDDTLSSSWYTEPENQIIKLSTPSKDMLWQIVSIYTIPAESYYLTHTFESDETYNKYLNTIIERSIYDFNVKVSPKDNILTLSTCLDNSGNRIVVHSKLVKSVDR